jgi:hypothetical protein
MGAFSPIISFTKLRSWQMQKPLRRQKPKRLHKFKARRIESGFVVTKPDDYARVLDPSTCNPDDRQMVSTAQQSEPAYNIVIF